MRFMAPALIVSLIIGGLHAFFAAAPVILIDGFQLSPVGLSMFLAATVVALFGGGLLAPWLSLRIGRTQATLLGTTLAFIGSVLALVAAGNGFPLIWYTISLMVYYFGMGFAYPLGTALALEPFGNQAGLASALLGFLQMCCASIATAANIFLPLPAATAIGVMLVVYAGLCLCLTISLVRRPRK
jgi:DHA1 family bicyclomycin/chloramphenicol resistance-like MFS transporter